MEENRLLKFSGHLDPDAQEFRPRISLSPPPPNQVSTHRPSHIYYPFSFSASYPSTRKLGFYSAVVHMPPPHQSLPVHMPPPQPVTLPPPSPTPTRGLILSSVGTVVSETLVRRELEVFGEVKSVQMERLHEGIVTVHFYDLRHAQEAWIGIREQHLQHQRRVRQYYEALHSHNHQTNLSFGLENFAPPPLPSPSAGLLAGRAIWAEFSLPTNDDHNQGTLIVFNLDPEVSSGRLKAIFEDFGPVKKLRESPLKRNQRLVEFFDIRDAAKARSKMQGELINGKRVVIEFCRPGINSPGINSRNNYNMKFAKYPCSKPPRRFMGRFSSDSVASNLSQPICLSEKYSYTGNVGYNKKSDHGRTTDAKGFVSQTIAGNRSWKGRHKKSDAHFLIREDAFAESDIKDTRTTIMIKNIPNKYSQKMLLNLLDNHCVNCNELIADGDAQPLSSYDFVYLPIDFNNKCNVGYGFVNFTSPQATLRLYKFFHMQPWEVFNSKKICEVTYARLQGLEALKEHFRNSQFACEIGEYLPVMFAPARDGKQLTEPLTIRGLPRPIICKTFVRKLTNDIDTNDGNEDCSGKFDDGVGNDEHNDDGVGNGNGDGEHGCEDHQPRLSHFLCNSISNNATSGVAAAVVV